MRSIPFRIQANKCIPRMLLVRILCSRVRAVQLLYVGVRFLQHFFSVHRAVLSVSSRNVSFSSAFFVSFHFVSVVRSPVQQHSDKHRSTEIAPKNALLPRSSQAALLRLRTNFGLLRLKRSREVLCLPQNVFITSASFFSSRYIRCQNSSFVSLEHLVVMQFYAFSWASSLHWAYLIGYYRNRYLTGPSLFLFCFNSAGLWDATFAYS